MKDNNYKEKIIEVLKEEGYSDYLIPGTLQKIDEMSLEIKPLFDKWISNHEIPDIEVEGFSLVRLIKDKQMKTIGAFLALDWLKKEPEVAKKVINQGIK